MADQIEKITLVPILDSSNIKAAGYSETTKTLAIQFIKGTIHHFAGVDAETVELFKRAESKGRFFAAFIRGRFQSKKIETPKEQ